MVERQLESLSTAREVLLDLTTCAVQQQATRIDRAATQVGHVALAGEIEPVHCPG